MTKAALSSPIGPIVIESDGDRLLSLRILAEGIAVPAELGPPPGGSLLADAAVQIAAYFARTLDDFDIPLAPAATPRGQELREAMIAIPIGETLSYGAFARIAGSAPRAIGQACARNPLPLIVPCHRVVGSGGTIGHYSGANGVATKMWLLDHEKRGGLL